VVPGRGGFRRETSTVIGIDLAKCAWMVIVEWSTALTGARFIAMTATQPSTA
jgi:hypothetical protein